MSAQDDGGPAFPRDHASDGHNGMTLRDYFAVKAMSSIMGGSWIDFQIRLRTGENIAQCTARYAYEYADAMLEARK